jgi:hypothetical protein
VVDQVKELWGTLSAPKIADRLGITCQKVYRLAAKAGLPKKSQLPTSADSDGPEHGDPTPEEIEELTAVIRSEWSWEEQDRRYVARRSSRSVREPISSALLFGQSEAPSFSRMR